MRVMKVPKFLGSKVWHQSPETEQSTANTASADRRQSRELAASADVFRLILADVLTSGFRGIRRAREALMVNQQESVRIRHGGIGRKKTFKNRNPNFSV